MNTYVLFYVYLVYATGEVYNSAEWAVTFGRDIDPILWANEKNIEFVHSIELLPRTHVFRVPPEQKRHTTSLEGDEVLWSQEQKVVQFARRSVYSEEKGSLPYTDPLLPTQWHLHNVTQPSDHVHINVVRVWEEFGITGKGVTIAIVDDGIQTSHPDLKNNWREGSANWNFRTNTENIQPTDTKEKHGTAVAGLAVAQAGNSICGVGVAPKAKFTGVVLGLSSTDVYVAQALAHAYGINQIYTNSWGPIDDGKRLEKPGPVTERILTQSIKSGRDGKGSIFVWAAGNGRQNKDNCNYDGYANSRYVVTLGAVNSKGVSTDYSEPCAALIAALPSGDERDKMQTTEFYPVESSNYVNATSQTVTQAMCNVGFTGTSAAAPLGSGIAALVLEANPSVTWLDLQYIFKLSTIRTDTSHPSWILNGAGTWVSTQYGFGILDATRAVTIARKYWSKSVEELQYSFSHQSIQKFVPSWASARGGPTERLLEASQTVISKMEVPSNMSSLLIHHIEVVVNINHKTRGDLDIRLVSPFGTESTLAEKHLDTNSNYENWKFVTLMSWGERPAGTWTLYIYDTNRFNPDTDAQLQEWTLNFYCIENNQKYYPPIIISPQQTLLNLTTASPYVFNFRAVSSTATGTNGGTSELGTDKKNCTKSLSSTNCQDPQVTVPPGGETLGNSGTNALTQPSLASPSSTRILVMAVLIVGSISCVIVAVIMRRRCYTQPNNTSEDHLILLTPEPHTLEELDELNDGED